MKGEGRKESENRVKRIFIVVQTSVQTVVSKQAKVKLSQRSKLLTSSRR
jgi:hypothetical protein